MFNGPKFIEKSVKSEEKTKTLQVKRPITTLLVVFTRTSRVQATDLSRELLSSEESWSRPVFQLSNSELSRAVSVLQDPGSRL